MQPALLYNCIALCNALMAQVERARTKVVPLKQLIDAVEEDIKESEHDEKVKAEIKEATESAIAEV